MTRSLVVVRNLPSPPRSGGDLRMQHVIGALAELGPTFVFGLSGSRDAPRDDLAGWRRCSVPDAARVLDEAGIAAAVQARRSPFAVELHPDALTELCAVVDEFAPDQVLIGAFELFGLLEVLRPRVERLVLDADFVRGVAFAEMGAADPDRRRGMLWRVLAPLVAEDERVAAEQADAVWVCTDVDAERMRAITTTTKVAVVPNAVDVDSYPPAVGPPDALVFPARFDYWPNEVAALTLARDVLPALPTATLSLVGMGPTPPLLALDDARIEVTGPVPDIRVHLVTAGAMPLPITAGGGTRLKVLEAFAARLPVVATAKAVEGLGVDPGAHYAEAESPEEFVAALGALRDDRTLAEQLIAEAHELVEEQYSLSALEASVRAACAP